MQGRQHYIDAYHAATKREADLWIQVKGKGPGTPGFNEPLWREWLEAVGRTTEASRALREAFYSTPPEQK